MKQVTIPLWPRSTVALANIPQLLELNIQRMAAHGHLDYEATIAHIREQDTAEGLPPRDIPGINHPLVKIVEEAGYEDFGFVMVRTEFTSESRWERFVERWNELLDMQFDNALPETGLQRIQGKLVTKMMDDEVVSGMGPQSVALYVCSAFLSLPPIAKAALRSIPRAMMTVRLLYSINGPIIIPY